MNKEKSIETMNQILKGEHMAIGFYNTYIDTVEDNSVKEWLETFKKNHLQHSELLTNRIKSLGGNPIDGGGMTGFVANTMAKARTALGIKQAEILKQLYDGEDQGIAKSKELIKGYLDDQSRILVHQILDSEQDHLKQLEKLIARTSGDL